MSDVADKRAKVEDQVAKDISKAQDFKILDSDIDKARKLIGIDVARGSEQQTWVGPATPNATPGVRAITEGDTFHITRAPKAPRE